MTTRLAADFLGQRVFTLDEVKDGYGLSDNAAWQAVRYAKRRGQIGTARRGLYYVVPPGSDSKTYRPDPYLLAAKAAPEGVLAYHAALDLHGVAHSALHEVAVAVPSWRRGFSAGGLYLRFVEASTSFGVDLMTREGVRIPVTDRERTLVDGCDRPSYMGGLEEFLRSVSSFPSISHARVIDYVHRYQRKSLASKVGSTLTRFRDRWGLPDDVERELQALRPRGNVVFEQASRRQLDAKWGVLYPSGLDRRLEEV